MMWSEDLEVVLIYEAIYKTIFAHFPARCPGYRWPIPKKPIKI